jgi:outer membrane protein
MIIEGFMRKIFLLLFLVTSACPQVTLRYCVQSALARHPGVKISMAEAEMAKQDWRQARAARGPSLDMNGSYRRQSSVPALRVDPIQTPFGNFDPFPGGMELGSYDNFDLRLTLSQPLFTGFKLRGLQQVLEAVAESKSAEVSRSRNELIFKVESAYASVLRAQKYLAIASSARQQVQMHLQDVESLVKQGMARPDELSRVRVKVSECDLGIVRAENGVQMARALLTSLIGENLPEDQVFSLPPADDLPPLDLNTSVEKAMAQRPEVTVLNRAAAATQAGKKIAQGAWLPNLAAFGTYAYGKPGLDFIKKDWMDYWLIGAGFEWNLWNGGRTRSQVQQADLKLTAILENQKVLRDAITLEVTQACLKLQEAVRSQAVARELDKLAEESYRVTRQRYQQGQASHSDFFDAQSEWTRAQLGAADSDIELTLAQASWRRAVGDSEPCYR